MAKVVGLTKKAKRRLAALRRTAVESVYRLYGDPTVSTGTLRLNDAIAALDELGEAMGVLTANERAKARSRLRGRLAPPGLEAMGVIDFLEGRERILARRRQEQQEAL